MAPPAGKQEVRDPISTSPKDIYHDFEWSHTDEPHATRRKQILAKHPEMAQLFGPEPRTLPIVLALQVLQLVLASWAQGASSLWFWLVAYAVGGTINHSLQLAVHELSHNLCFDSPTANRLLMVVGNFVTGFPSGLTFQRYHMEHHQFQGVDQVDTDVPTVAEVNFFRNSPWRKVLALLLQPAFYALRPLLVKPMPYTRWELFNAACQFSFNYAVYRFLGPWALVYLVASTLLGLGLHPVAGHFVAEHYTFVKGVETYSYYGPLNYVAFNVGLHNEHHDFPRIPWSRLWRVREIAPEFYNNLPQCKSWVGVLYDYVMDPEVGPYSRIKRRQPEKKAE